jgi:hypothetical protein
MDPIKQSFIFTRKTNTEGPKVHLETGNSQNTLHRLPIPPEKLLKYDQMNDNEKRLGTRIRHFAAKYIPGVTSYSYVSGVREGMTFYAKVPLSVLQKQLGLTKKEAKEHIGKMADDLVHIKVMTRATFNKEDFDKLSNDDKPGVLLEKLKTDPTAINWLSEEMKKDEAFLLKCVKQNPRVWEGAMINFKYLTPEFRFEAAHWVASHPTKP